MYVTYLEKGTWFQDYIQPEFVDVIRTYLPNFISLCSKNYQADQINF